jgi:hypothetical protein
MFEFNFLKRKRVIYQVKNQAILKPIQDTGCALLSDYFIVCHKLKRRMTNFKANYLYNNLYAKGFISAECTILTAGGGFAGICNKMYKILKSPVKGTFVHVGNDKIYISKPERTDYTLIIYDTPWSEYGGEHYKVGDSEGKVIYDAANGTLDDHIRFREFLRFRFDKV